MSESNDPAEKEGEIRDTRKFVKSLARGLSVLRAFKPGDGVLSNREIAQRTGLPKPTVTRLTYTLTQLGYLQYNPSLERYQLAMSAMALGYAALSNMSIRKVAQPLMQDLAEDLNCTVALGIRDDLTMMYIDNQRGRAAVTLRLDVGSHIPIATTAMGRAFLVTQAENERNSLMQRLERLDHDNWPMIRDGIKAAWRKYHRDGFVSVVGGWNREVNAVGVPLVLSSDEVYALNCGGASFLMPENRLEEEVGPRLRQLAAKIQANFSYF